ncbi:hypothetical protein EV141_1899 [Microcella putealis]|uniref:Ligand-binding SRPBCC domain-containing protein n=1 Tax=Microcella putealis TaxID=337005 RepID=A0A4Q7LP10_9MICO|nr:hypothetical protein [Microcella putealis]RZS56435.1 hypothetical protein EV141_1899 [Microcella putealis]TQM27079.1 hypothetical protein BJ957_0502 [Microcella putealis]
MRVTLHLVLDCPPDAAWEAVHSPAVFRAVSGPWTTVESLEPGGFPERWPGGDHRVRLRMLGALPMGTQLIRLSDEIAPGERVVHDTGGPLSGPMRIVRSWHHRMGISAAAGDAGRTQFHDVLTVKAGVLTPVVAAGFWVFWRLRGRALRRLAPGWSTQFGGPAS